MQAGTLSPPHLAERDVADVRQRRDDEALLDSKVLVAVRQPRVVCVQQWARQVA